MSSMSEQDPNRKFAYKSATIVNETFEKGKATAERSARAAEQTYSVTVENIRTFNVKMIDVTRANVEAVLDLSLQIAMAKGPAEIVELWTTHAPKQFGILNEQTRELTALAQKMARESAESMTRGVNQAFNQVS